MKIDWRGLTRNQKLLTHFGVPKSPPGHKLIFSTKVPHFQHELGISNRHAWLMASWDSPGMGSTNHSILSPSQTTDPNTACLTTIFTMMQCAEGQRDVCIDLCIPNTHTSLWRSRMSKNGDRRFVFPVSGTFQRNVFHLALWTSWLAFQHSGVSSHQSLGDWCAFHGLAWVRCDVH